MTRELHIRQAVRAQIIDSISEWASGSLEEWKPCESGQERRWAKAECRRMIRLIKALGNVEEGS